MRDEAKKAGKAQLRKPQARMALLRLQLSKALLLKGLQGHSQPHSRAWNVYLNCLRMFLSMSFRMSFQIVPECPSQCPSRLSRNALPNVLPNVPQCPSESSRSRRNSPQKTAFQHQFSEALLTDSLCGSEMRMKELRRDRVGNAWRTTSFMVVLPTDRPNEF